jgi:hypothetical protein
MCRLATRVLTFLLKACYSFTATNDEDYEKLKNEASAKASTGIVSASVDISTEMNDIHKSTNVQWTYSAKGIGFTADLPAEDKVR